MAQVLETEKPHEAHYQPFHSNRSRQFMSKAAEMCGLKPSHRIRDVNSEFDDKLTLGQRIADGVAATMGSWKFIIIQSTILFLWIILNTVALINHWDPYPFILLNLALSFQAAYAAPFIMMSQNRQSAKDRLTAQNDYEVNKLGEAEIQAVLLHLEEQDRFMLQILNRLEQSPLSTDGNAVASTFIPPINNRPMDEAHRQKVEADMWASVNTAVSKSQLGSTEVRDAIEHCYAVVNIESFQRNSLLDQNYSIDEGKLSILKILFKETFISVGADYIKPDREDLEEVRAILLERMQHRNLDPELVAKFAEISTALVERLAE